MQELDKHAKSAQDRSASWLIDNFIKRPAAASACQRWSQRRDRSTETLATISETRAQPRIIGKASSSPDKKPAPVPSKKSTANFFDSTIKGEQISFDSESQINPKAAGPSSGRSLAPRKEQEEAIDVEDDSATEDEAPVTKPVAKPIVKVGSPAKSSPFASASPWKPKASTSKPQVPVASASKPQLPVASTSKAVPRPATPGMRPRFSNLAYWQDYPKSPVLQGPPVVKAEPKQPAPTPMVVDDDDDDSEATQDSDNDLIPRKKPSQLAPPPPVQRQPSSVYSQSQTQIVPPQPPAGQTRYSSSISSARPPPPGRSHPNASAINGSSSVRPPSPGPSTDEEEEPEPEAPVVHPTQQNAHASEAIRLSPVMNKIDRTNLAGKKRKRAGGGF